MIDPTYCQAMAAYNHWMNQRLYAICAQLSDEARCADRGAFFKSIHGTLNHLLVGDRIWIGRFLQQSLTQAKVADELYSNFAELRQQRDITDRQILDWAATLSGDWLSQPFTYRSGLDGKTRTFPAWLLVTHLFSHQTHHRGQLTTLLMQQGYDPGVTDLPWMPEIGAIVGCEP